MYVHGCTCLVVRAWLYTLAGRDSLAGEHANTHLPEIVGVARGWELTGNATLQRITRNFMTVLAANYTYATGGSNVGEHWRLVVVGQ